MVNASLKALHSEASSNLAGIISAFAHLADSAINRQPASNHWSIAQCLDHIVVSDRLYYERLRRAVVEGHRTKRYSEDGIRPSFLGRYFIRLLGPDGRRMKSPRLFTPSNDHRTGPLLADFADHQKELMELLRRADGLPVNVLRLSSPVSRVFRFSLGEVFLILLAHQKRHLNQTLAISRWLSENP